MNVLISAFQCLVGQKQMIKITSSQDAEIEKGPIFRV